MRLSADSRPNPCSPGAPRSAPGERGMLLIHLLVYMAVLAIIMSLASVTFWRAFDSVRQHLQAADEASALLRAGELWRQDVRRTRTAPVIEETSSALHFRLGTADGPVTWSVESNRLVRVAGTDGIPLSWMKKLETAQFVADDRGSVRAWRLEVSLPSPKRGERMPVAFSFIAVPQSEVKP
jgi:type II secretory pathway pseudopilin PulG